MTIWEKVSYIFTPVPVISFQSTDRKTRHCTLSNLDCTKPVSIDLEHVSHHGSIDLEHVSHHGSVDLEHVSHHGSIDLEHKSQHISIYLEHLSQHISIYLKYLTQHNYFSLPKTSDTK